MAFSISTATLLLLVFSATFAALFLAPAAADNHLLPGQMLKPGEFLQDGHHLLIMQRDCNLVLYNLNLPRWSSRSSDQGSGCYATLQSDGNFAVYDDGNNVIWSTNTGGQNGSFLLVLQKDGDVVLYGERIFGTGAMSPAKGARLSGAERIKVWELKKKIAVVTDKLV